MSKKSLWKKLIAGGVFFVLLGAFGLYYFLAAPKIQLNQVALTDLKEVVVSLDEYRGKPLVVNYWATWCAPCIEEFPHFEELKQQLGDDVNFVMISDESLGTISNFSKSKPYTFTYLRSIENLKEYGFNVRPTTMFYNTQGELVTARTGALSTEDLLDIIGQLK